MSVIETINDFLLDRQNKELILSSIAISIPKINQRLEALNYKLDLYNKYKLYTFICILTILSTANLYHLINNFTPSNIFGTFGLFYIYYFCIEKIEEFVNRIRQKAKYLRIVSETCDFLKQYLESNDLYETIYQNMRDIPANGPVFIIKQYLLSHLEMVRPLMPRRMVARMIPQHNYEYTFAGPEMSDLQAELIIRIKLHEETFEYHGEEFEDAITNEPITGEFGYTLDDCNNNFIAYSTLKRIVKSQGYGVKNPFTNQPILSIKKWQKV